MNLNEMDIELISDLLANFHDWDVNDLKSEFIQNLKENDVQLPEAVMVSIYDRFMKIESSERYGLSFNHKKFTIEALKNLH